MQVQHRTWLITAKASPLVVALHWSVLAWLPEHMLPGSVCGAEMMWERQRLLPLNSESLISPQVREVPRLFVECRHSLSNLTVTSTVWFHLPTQMCYEPASLHQPSLFFSNPGQALSHPFLASREGGTSQGLYLAAEKSLTCSAQGCCYCSPVIAKHSMCMCPSDLL